MSYPNPSMNVLDELMRYEDANDMDASPLNFNDLDASAFEQEIDAVNNTRKMYMPLQSGGRTLVKEEPFRLPGMKAVDRFVGNVGIDIANNVMNTVMDVEDFLRDKGLDIPFFRVEEGGIRYAPASERRADLARAKEQGLPRPNFNFQNMEGAGAIEQAVQPMASFIGTMLLTPGGLIPKTASAAFTMNPELGNLSTFLKELGINNEVIDFLDSKVDAQADAEQRLIARVKNLAEEGIISAALEATLVPSLVVAKQLMQQFGGQRLPDLAAKAQARIDERAASSTLYSGVDPTPLIDEAIVAANKVIGNKQVDSVPQPKIDPQDNIARIEAPTDNEPGIIAFHGSGADFDEFRLDKIGTGEGAQVYGKGLYFTDTEDIAKFYKNQVSKTVFETVDGKRFDPYDVVDGVRTIQNLNIRAFISKDGDVDGAISLAKKLIKNIPSAEDYKVNNLPIQGYDTAKKDLQLLEKIKRKGGLIKKQGRIYKVGLAPKSDELLDYDLPLSEQSEFIKNNPIIKRLIQEDANYRQRYPSNPIGERRGGNVLNTVSEADLNASGIKGIKYLDNASRNTSGGKLLGIDKLDDGQFQARIVLDDPGRQTGLGGGGRVITTSKPYKSQKEAEDWANKEMENKSSNYVIFDDAAINILAKYGIVGPVAVTALSKPEPTKNEQ